MEMKEIRAVELVRRIRDEYAEEFEGLSHAEIIALIRARARALHDELGLAPIGDDTDKTAPSMRRAAKV